MKRGFTLIEVLAVLVLLGIISLIAYPIVSNSINESREKAYNIQIDSIENGAYKWSIDNINELSKYVDTSVNISDLISGGYITKTEDGKLYNPKNNEVMTGCVIIGYSTEYNQYLYNYDEECKMDNSGANKPVLFTNMEPVIWNGEQFVKADITTKWYDYDKKEWANAVVLNDGIAKNVGDAINVDTEVALMFVWIPRYKYTIFNGNNESVPEQEINIAFENGTAKTGTVTCNDDLNQTDSSGNLISEICTDSSNGSILNGTSTYTHPAFTFGTQELTGIWVGKFESSTTDASCNDNQNATSCNKVLPVTIKPNVRSWRNATVSTFYTSISNISSNYVMNVDSHMMKNMEWGAVAYLAQSKYGRCNSGTCTEIAKNDSSNYYTGRSQGITPPTSDYSTNGTYTYEASLGQLASTTGNIYGIYDMSGGAWEVVMGNMVNSSNQFYNSDAEFSTNPLPKYYDAYTYDGSSNKTHSRGKLGDATKETLKTYGSGGGGWYDDWAFFTDSNNAWFYRSGEYSYSSRSGIFNFSYDIGTSYDTASARAVVVSIDNN